MSDPHGHQPRYPLRAVMRRTGLSADVIRAWERRYGAVTPQRSSGGQRLYSEQDVVRLGLLRRATTAGHSIGEIARLDADALESLVQSAASAHRAAHADDIGAVVTAALGATERFDAVELERVLKRAVFAVGVERFVDGVVSRFLTEVGDRWHRGSISPAHEHVASDTVRRVLTWVAEAYEPVGGAPRIVIATLSGEMHELGAMAAASVAVSEGWRVVYLGSNLPPKDVAAAAQHVGAAMIALSVVYAVGDVAARQIIELARLVPVGVELVIGGASAPAIEPLVREAGVRVLATIDSLRSMLRARRDEPLAPRSEASLPDVR